MKKFKSLLSLLFVMILMLQMVGPMAFAANTLSISVSYSGYDSGSGRYVAKVDSTEGLAKGDKLSATVVYALSDNDTTLTPTLIDWSVTNKAGDDVSSYYDTPVVNGYNYYKAVIQANAPVMNSTTGKLELPATKYYVVSGPTGLTVDANTEMYSIGSETYADFTSGKKIFYINGGAIDSSRFIDVDWRKSESVTNPANLSVVVKANAPYMTEAGKFVSNGLAEPAITVNGVGYNVSADIEVKEVGNTWVAVPSNAEIFPNGGADISDKFKVTYENGVYEKPVVTLTSAAPVYDHIKNAWVGDASKATAEVSSGELKIAGINVWLDFTLDVVDYGSYVTSTPKNIKAYITTGGQNVDVSSAFQFATPVAGKFTKEVITITPNPLKEVNGSYVPNGYTDDAAELNVGNVVEVSGYQRLSNGSIRADGITVWRTINGHTYDITNRYAYNLIARAPSGTITDNGSNNGGDNNGNNNGGGNVTTKIQLDIMAVDADKAYNGKSFSKSQAQGVKFINNTGLLSGHSIGDGLKIQYTRRSDGFTFTDYTDVYKVGTYDKELVALSKNVVVDSNGNDVTDQYDIDLVDGILTIYRAGYVSPDTGDHSNIGLWITLLGISAVAVVAVVIVIFKKKNKNA